MGDMTKNLNRSEFACPCGCGLDRIDPDFVDNLQISRDATGFPYDIKNGSGCRCPYHNKAVGGKENSAHLPYAEDDLCHAADIPCADSHMMYMIGWDLIRRFKRIEFGKKIGSDGKIKLWIHVDNRRDLPQEVLILN